MDIIACLKRVPLTAEAEVKVDATGKGIIKDRLTFDMNESDTYALEQAILTKEKSGGTLTVVSVGYPEAEETLRIALAKGADNAIRVKAEDFDNLDGYMTAQLINLALKDKKYDLVLTGCMATDDYNSQVGIILAELLGITHASFVTKIEIDEGRAQAYRELEGGLLEHLDIQLPALFTIQTGINEPRYASLIAIRKAAKKEITVLGKNELPIDPLANVILDELYPPPVGKRAEIIVGAPDESAGKLAHVLKEKGLV